MLARLAIINGTIVLQTPKLNQKNQYGYWTCIVKLHSEYNLTLSPLNEYQREERQSRIVSQCRVIQQSQLQSLLQKEFPPNLHLGNAVICYDVSGGIGLGPIFGQK